MFQPFHYSAGPRNAKIALVGEAWGDQEALTGAPFMGASGQELSKMLKEAGLSRSECFLTNVFALQPESNNIEALCGPKAAVGKDYLLPPLRIGKYFLREHLPHLERLRIELEAVRPNITVALGNVACWALLHATSISKIRGAITEQVLISGLKTLPTYHPASVLRNWAQRPIVLADLMKVKREADFPEIRRPARTILVDPTLEEIAEWFTRPASHYSVDIETKLRQIEMIGFARSPEDALVVPFVQMHKPERSYWPTLEQELSARRLVYSALTSPTPKIFQNGMYDLQYLAREGCYPRACLEDTMLLHHALYPELPKGLGFLGSVYSNEAAWKLMRKTEALKKDE